MSNSTCTVLSCKDSTLSTAGNVIGILTFAVGVLVGLIVRSRLIANSTAELALLMEDFESVARQFEKFGGRLQIYTAERSSDSAYDHDVDDLRHLMQRAGHVREEIASKMYKLKVRGTYSKREVVMTSVKSVTEQAELTGLLKKAQSLLREVQLGMMQLEQDLMRRSLVQVNGDQMQRSNALYEMLLDHVIRLDAERTSPLQSQQQVSSEDPSPDFQDILSTMARPNYQTVDLEQQSNVTRPAEDRYIVALRTQIQNAISRQQDTTSDSRSQDIDPLGTLLRARTMPVETREMVERFTKSEGDAAA